MPRTDPVQNVGRVYQTLLSLVKSNDISANALKLIKEAGVSYAYANKPKSLYPGLTGNTNPGVTELRWLANQNKCNQFVGDVLFNSGYDMPTNKMADGSLHYKSAITLPNQSAYFSKRASLEDIRPGDVYVKDYGRGDGVGHTEIVISVSKDKDNVYTITTAGAHKNGAYTTEMKLTGYSYNNAKQGWTNGIQSIYFLKPIKTR